MNSLDFETYLQLGRHCELSSVELHPDELEVLTWSEVWLLVVDDPAEKLEYTDGRLGVQFGLFGSICSDQPVV